MFLKIILFLTGFGFCVIGLVFTISYLNLLTIGYNFLDYVNFIIRRFECLISLIGIIFIFLAINIGGKYDIHI